MEDLSRCLSTQSIHPLSDSQPLTTLSAYYPEGSVLTQRYFHTENLYLVTLGKYHMNHCEEVLVMIPITFRKKKENKLVCVNYF